MRIVLLATVLVAGTGIAFAGTLHELAADRTKLDEVRRALEAGEDPNQPNEESKTPLEIAAVAGNTEIVEALLKGGADVNGRGKKNRTALAALAANHEWTVEPDLGERLAASAELLLRHGATVDPVGDVGWTPLVLAAANGNTPVVAVLLEHDADVAYALPSGYQAIHQAAARGQVDAVRMLLEAGADPKYVTFDGRNVMQLAEWYEQAEVIELLKAAGE